LNLLIEESVEYTITVETANKIGAGTDSNVFINIHGENKETGKIMLKETTTNKNPFEKGKIDIFNIIAANVGEIKKINISHDGKILK
jgi:lipoxygenase homology domain-containing protein 1